MSEPEWRLLTTLSDLPTAQLLAGILGEEGIAVRVMSDAGVLGLAAPSRIYVGAAQLQRARHLLSQRELSDEELGQLAAGAPPVDEP
jgi:Putative prokaryotic signal transducing protein